MNNDADSMTTYSATPGLRLFRVSPTHISLVPALSGLFRHVASMAMRMPASGLYFCFNGMLRECGQKFSGQADGVTFKKTDKR